MKAAEDARLASESVALAAEDARLALAKMVLEIKEVKRILWEKKLGQRPRKKPG